MMQGYDIELVRSVADSVDIPVTAIGGAGGSMFVFYGRLGAVLITAPREHELVQEGIYDELECI